MGMMLQPHWKLRIRPRYTLRTLLVLVTLAAALFGYESYVSWKEERAAGEIEKLYGSVEYEHIGPAWLRRFAGEVYLRRVTKARIHAATTDDAIRSLKQFGRLGKLSIFSDLPGEGGFNRDDITNHLPDVTCSIDPALTLNRWMYHAGLDVAERILEQTSEARHGTTRPGWFRGFAVVVRLVNADYRLLIVAEHMSGTGGTIYLIDGMVLVDWKVCEAGTRVQFLPFIYVTPQTADLNEDGIVDVGFHVASRSGDLDMSRMLRSNPSLTRYPTDARYWLAAYEITPTGFKLLFESDTAGAAESASTE